MSDIEVILRAIIEGFCLQPVVLILGIFLCFAIPFILTLKAFLVRLYKDKQAKRSPLPTIILVLTLPFGLGIAWILAILGKFAKVLLNFFIVVLISLLSIPAFIIHAYRRLPGIIQGIMQRALRFGERLLSYVESSPRRFVEKIDAAWGEDVAQVVLHSATKPHLKLISDPFIRKNLDKIGLSGENLLEQYLHNPYIRQERPVYIIHALGKMRAWESLIRLGRDPNTKEDIRAMAATELEKPLANEAARIWIALGKRSTTTLYQMKAADHLIRLGYFDQAKEILNLVSSKEDLDPRWTTQVCHLQRKLNITPSGVSRAPTRQDTISQLQNARILFKDGLVDEATDLLSSIVVSPDEVLRARLQAVQTLHSNGRKEALMKLLSNHDLPAEVRYHVIQAIGRMGGQPVAVRQYQTLVENESIPLKNRVDAAAALAQIDQSECTHDLILYLAGHRELDGQLRIELALALHVAGWQHEASQILAELIKNPGTDRETKTKAQRVLARLKTLRNNGHK